METEIQKDLRYFENRIERLGLKGSCALHIGSRNVLWTQALKKHFGSVVAIEYIHSEACQPDEWQENHLHDKLVTGEVPLKKLPFQDESFDAVFCSITIPFPKETFEDLSRIIKDQGELYFNYNGTIYDRLLSDPDPHYMELHAGSWMSVLMSYMVGLMRKMDRSLVKKFLFASKRRKFDKYYKIKAAVHQIGMVVFLHKLVNKYFFKTETTNSNINNYDIRNLKRISESGLKEIYNEVTNALKKVSLQKHVNQQDKIIIHDFLVCAYYLNLYGNIEQKRKILSELFLRILSLSGEYHDLFTHKVVVPPRMYFFDYLELFGFREIGTSLEGNLIINADVKCEGPDYSNDEYIFETLLIKEAGQIDEGLWPTADYLRSSNRWSAYRFSNLRSNHILSNERFTPSMDHFLTKHLQNTAKTIPHDRFLSKLVREVTFDAVNDEDAFLKLYRFIQDVLFHHPSIQLMKKHSQYENDAVVILLSGIGRCGHVSSVVADLFGHLGYKTKVRQMFRHLTAEVFDGARWRLVDADAFKGGSSPRTTKENG